MKALKMLAAALIMLSCIQLVALVGPTAAVAQEAAEPDKDKTGTNPVNFTYDFRLITEMQSLRDDGGSLLKHTVELRAPLGADLHNLKGEGWYSQLGQRFALRFRGYYQSLSVGNPSEAQVSGIGDFDARILGVAYSSNKFILVPGLEAFFNTASDDALGSGKNALGPVAFAVFPGLVGKGSLFADPEFVSGQKHSAQSYRLKSTSPAIGRGIKVTENSRDYNNVLRDELVDIGAFEFGVEEEIATSAKADSQ